MTQPNPAEARTVQLRLPPAVEERLREKAKQLDLTLEVYLEELAEQDASANGHPDPLELAVKRLTSRTPEQVLADRERILAATPRRGPCPKGKPSSTWSWERGPGTRPTKRSTRCWRSSRK